MISKLKYILGLCLIVFGLSAVNAQSKRDSSNAEIQQQALEMRQKLNKYMADKLLEEQVIANPGMQLFFDSISTSINKQQIEIDELKKQFAALEKAIKEGTLTVNNNAKNVRANALDTLINDVARGATFHRIGAKQLNLYFSFDNAKITTEQKAELRKFLGSRKSKLVKVIGYTDWIGTEKYNEALAADRCLTITRVVNGFKIRHRVSTNINCNNDVYNPDKAKWCRRVEIILQ
ncbi:MAG: OmpA family protein [Bacteroidia bacterium]|nr:OmpA family protein [Bacteroidia bacterium]